MPRNPQSRDRPPRSPLQSRPDVQAKRAHPVADQHEVPRRGSSSHRPGIELVPKACLMAVDGAVPAGDAREAGE